jgi:hypothetical protein
MERNGIDYVFAVGLILVGVIAVAELQFTNFFLGQNLGQNQLSHGQIWIQIFFVFKATMVPIFVLVVIWLTAMIFPHTKTPLAKRRYLKEFCWALFGNVLALEIVLFSLLLSASEYLKGGIGWEVNLRIFELVPSFFLTLLVTWQYRRMDSAKSQNATRFGLITVIEHGLIYLISYFAIWMIVLSSILMLL